MKSNRNQVGTGWGIGLTGGIACGKSEAGRIFETLGAAVLDADTVAHAVMERGEPVYEAVVDRFGIGILAADGQIDRRVLGQHVFAHPQEREALNALVHPAVRRYWQAWMAEQRARGQMAVCIIPLLFEVSAADEFDVVVCVSASESTVLARLEARGLTPEEARLRMAAQWPVAEKTALADYVIQNDGTRENLEQQVKEVWHTILSKEKRDGREK